MTASSDESTIAASHASGLLPRRFSAGSVPEWSLFSGGSLQRQYVLAVVNMLPPPTLCLKQPPLQALD
jgi:hypothetical protein